MMERHVDDARRMDDRPRDTAYVEYWLRRAGMTLLSLPDRGPILGWRPQSEELRRSLAEQAAERRLLRRTPSAVDISAMDVALGWLRLVPDDRRVLRRIVAARMLVSPTTERHLYSWRQIARLVGADHHAVQRWHAQGINHIVRGLKALEDATPGMRRAA
jgi:hypothetical protein